MDNHRQTSTNGRLGRKKLVPWESFESYASVAFVVAGTSLLASLFAPLALLVVTDRSWIAGISLVGFGVVAAAFGLLGLHPRASVDSRRLAVAGAAFAATAAIAGSVVLALAGLTGVAMHLPDVAFSVGKQEFVVLSLTMAAGYALGFLSYGIGIYRSSSEPDRTGVLLTTGGLLLLLPVAAGVLQFTGWSALRAWVVFLTLGLVAVDTVAVGLGLRSTS